jgi:hypothetical protein
VTPELWILLSIAVCNWRFGSSGGKFTKARVDIIINALLSTGIYRLLIE